MKKLQTIASALAALAVCTGVGLAQDTSAKSSTDPTEQVNEDLGDPATRTLEINCPGCPVSDPTFPENPLPKGATPDRPAQIAVHPVSEAKPLNIARTIEAMERDGRVPVVFNIGSTRYDLRTVETDAEKRRMMDAMQKRVNRLAPGDVIVVWQEEDPPQGIWPWGFSYEILPADDNCLMEEYAPDVAIQEMCFP